MDKAFDSILRVVVSAADADPDDRYRYSCLCCQELVYVASPEQKVQVVHFRHHRGNSGKEDCENYIPQPGQSIKGPKNDGINVAFYYDEAKNLFSIAVSFSEEDIQEFGGKGKQFELRASYTSQPFYHCPISTTHFYPDSATKIPLELYSDGYYVSLSGNGKRHKHVLFEPGSPAFFKVLGNAEASFSAKHIQSHNLYTDTLYFVVASDEGVLARLFALANIVRRLNFHTMNHNFTGALLRFEVESADLRYCLHEFGYHLEASEELTVLWPPMAQSEDTFLSDASAIYVSSSFQMRPKGNTNATDSEITLIAEGVTRLNRTEDVRIHCKNAEAIIRRFAEPQSHDDKPLTTEEYTKTLFQVPDSIGCWLLHRKGTYPLRSGVDIALLPGDRVEEYLHTYPIKRITAQPEMQLEGQALLEDILRNYKVNIPYVADELDRDKLSKVAIRYLMDCSRSGLINQKVKELIGSGLI